MDRFGKEAGTTHAGNDAGEPAGTNSVEPLKAKSTPFLSAVVVDHRGAGSGVIGASKQTDGVIVRRDRLKLGDYLVNNVCLFEPKRLPDFAESIKAGRLFAQASRLASWPDRAAIIIEGAT